MRDEHIDRFSLPPGGKHGFFDAEDGTPLRFAVWPARPDRESRGTAVLLSGRQEFIEKHAETVHELLDRGLAVYTFDWRGQGLSGRPLEDRRKGHIESFDEYLRDLKQFMAEFVLGEAPQPIFLIAHSMGAHLALRYMHDCPDIIDRAVFSAPMIDIVPRGFPRWLFKAIVALAIFFGRGERYALGQDAFVRNSTCFAGNRLTSDPGRFHVQTGAVAANPNLALGGATFGWVRAALRSITALDSDDYPENIHTPVLFLQAGEDRVVNNAAQDEIVQRIPRGVLEVVEGAKHELLHERDEYRDRFWSWFDRFCWPVT